VAAKVLFIVNDPVAPPAMLADVFADLGYDVDEFGVVPPDRVDDPTVEVSFPDPLNYDVIVPLGARWAAYDERIRNTWVADEMALVRAADAAGAGVLGVCFGGQLVAQAHGGTVTRSTDPEIGWHPVHTAAPELIPGGPWFQWHFDRFTTPPGATELARNDRAVQAFTIGHTVGLQFHPELDAPLLEAWLDNDGAEAEAHGLVLDELRSQTSRLQSDARARLHNLVRGFLDRVAGQPCPS
jgi:GMP synthase-like glutamine amidotransferase